MPDGLCSDVFITAGEGPAVTDRDGGRAVSGYLRALRENEMTGLTEWNPMAETR